MALYPNRGAWLLNRKYAKAASDRRYLIAVCLAIGEKRVSALPPLLQWADKARADLDKFHCGLGRLMTLWRLTLRQSVQIILYTKGLKLRISAD